MSVILTPWQVSSGYEEDCNQSRRFGGLKAGVSGSSSGSLLGSNQPVTEDLRDS